MVLAPRTTRRFCKIKGATIYAGGRRFFAGLGDSENLYIERAIGKLITIVADGQS